MPNMSGNHRFWQHGTGMQADLDPRRAGSVAEFVELMQTLKKRSGLTFRQLEERAASNGDVLARSTLADVLRRGTLPRPEVVAAFVRACGVEQDPWLTARKRIAESLLTADLATDRTEPEPETTGTAASAGTTIDAAPYASAPSPPRGLRSRIRPWIIAVAGVLLLVLGVWQIVPRQAEDRATGSPPRDENAPTPAVQPPADGIYLIRTAGAPHMCLTEGRDRQGRYQHAVAAQVPCASAIPQTSLKATGNGLFFIRWRHPDGGIGCLTVLQAGPIRDMLEPREDCSDENPAQHFRFEPVADDTTPRTGRLRAAGSGLCLGLLDPTGAETAAEAVQEPCDQHIDQRFVLEFIE
ncbi:helix-turn-helix domain-containing protein [Polymorphospora sp. NPDC051019]|uniref:helix-turn-helix domain-containing protein n=1 Tax=Polymorphospora sp. NPDC051019 TaxID=3155725 RepID=UPI00341CA553